MKKLLSIVLALTLIIAVLPATAFAASSKTVYISRNGGKIYLHTGPRYDYEVGSTVKHKAKVTVQDKSGSWSKVKLSSNGKTGWIRTMYIDGTTKELANGYKAIKVSSGKSVSVYSDWKVTASVCATLKKGDTVKVNGTEHDFAKVVVTGSGVIGWVPIRYIGSTVTLDAEKPSTSGNVYHTTASVLNLRQGAGTKYAVIAKLPYGTGCTVLKSSGNWRKVKTFTGLTGWVSKNYLSKQTTARVATHGSNLNIRKKPGMDTVVIGSLKNGTKVTVKSTSGNWAYVSYGKLTGWMSLTWLKF